MLIWQFNQLVLVHLFHCRTTIEGFFFYKSYYQWTNIYLNMPSSFEDAALHAVNLTVPYSHSLLDLQEDGPTLQSN